MHKKVLPGKTTTKDFKSFCQDNLVFLSFFLKKTVFLICEGNVKKTQFAG